MRHARRMFVLTFFSIPILVAAGFESAAGAEAAPVVLASSQQDSKSYFQSSLLFQDAPGTGRNRSATTGFSFDALVRAFYFNDQRVEWSGQEATFGTEAIGAARYLQGDSFSSYGVTGEVYLRQPYENNILLDPVRRSYRANWEYDTLEMSQLYVDARVGNFYAAAGKFTTPFGRSHSPIFSNSRIGAPFIRSDAVLWRETGLLLRYAPGALNATVAVTNGGFDLDTNSSKAFVGRVGFDAEEFAIGASAKYQDGIGSEQQKIYDNHIGIDAMCRKGNFVLSSEVLYDQYGFRKSFNPDDIFWGRSIYYRDYNKAYHKPIVGVGYYVDATYVGDSWLLGMNFGQYFPEEVGVPQHDATITRGIVRVAKHLCDAASIYSEVIVESDLPAAQAGRTRRGNYFLTGAMIAF